MLSILFHSKTGEELHLSSVLHNSVLGRYVISPLLGRYVIRSFCNRRTVYQSGSGSFRRCLQRYF